MQCVDRADPLRAAIRCHGAEEVGDASDSNQFYLEEDFLAGHGQSKSFRTSFRVGGSCFCCDRSYRNQPAAPGILNDTTSM